MRITTPLAVIGRTDDDGVMGARGLEVVFDPALDGAGWPGPLAGREAAFGETWLGPLGLLARLETELGLVAVHPTPLQRATALARDLVPRGDEFWAASFATEPVATAQRMLADRDLLALWGWEGEPAGERLAQLWSATSNATDGVPDRLRQVLRVLAPGRVDIARITMFEERDALAPLWRRTVDALERCAVEILHVVLSAATAVGDLAGSRTAPFSPVGDGTLRLVRPQGPRAAADEVAAALAACESLDGVVIVNPDAALDAALVWHGLPCLGQSRGATSSSALVRLVVATAFTPMEPDDLYALLVADPGPVPRKVGSRLATALGKLPGRGSPLWVNALTEGLAQIDEERRNDVAERIRQLVDPVVARDGALSFEQLTDRMRALATWARGRALSVASLLTTAVLAENVITLARMSGKAVFDRTALRRLLDELDAPAIVGPAADVGLSAVSNPGAVVGPARVVIWWNFTRDHAPSPMRLRLSRAERDALRSAGIEPPDPGAVMASEARRWRRPLTQASEALLLVCPYTDECGAPTHPHPLWDELTSSIAEGASGESLTARTMMLPAQPRRERVQLRPLVVAAESVRTTTSLTLRDRESPSSLETLLGCSLRWALQYLGNLYSNVGAGPGEPGPLLYGNLAHHVLAEVFGRGVVSPTEAADRAGALFDAGLGPLAESLLLPDYGRQRAELRHGLVESAREVGRMLAATGASIRGVEHALERQLGGTTVKGTSDLLLSGPDFVIDYKWGTSTYKKLLSSGSAFQLVAYAALAKADAELPEVAYLALSTQQFIAPPSANMPNARTPGQHSTRAMHDGALAAIDARRAELARGELSAPGALEDVESEGLVTGVMQLEPKCGYCNFAAVCGKATRS
jgi:ATP-dependent helicase/nuclease subunit B